MSSVRFLSGLAERLTLRFLQGCGIVSIGVMMVVALVAGALYVLGWTLLISTISLLSLIGRATVTVTEKVIFAPLAVSVAILEKLQSMFPSVQRLTGKGQKH